MPLNKVSGNMYSFVTHTWNPIKGICPHLCSYCYMSKIYKRFGKVPKPANLDEKELKTKLGRGNFIFVGSSCDMFAEDIPAKWIAKVLEHCKKYPINKYLLQSKNPRRLIEFNLLTSLNTFTGTTIESNRIYPCMGNVPTPNDKAIAMEGHAGFITVEPILDFDLDDFLAILKKASPDYIYIGADSGNNRLPEPSKEKILELITELEKFTSVHKKPNLGRLLKETS